MRCLEVRSWLKPAFSERQGQPLRLQGFLDFENRQLQGYVGDGFLGPKVVATSLTEQWGLKSGATSQHLRPAGIASIAYTAISKGPRSCKCDFWTPVISKPYDADIHTCKVVTQALLGFGIVMWLILVCRAWWSASSQKRVFRSTKANDARSVEGRGWSSYINRCLVPLKPQSNCFNNDSWESRQALSQPRLRQTSKVWGQGTKCIKRSLGKDHEKKHLLSVLLKRIKLNSSWRSNKTLKNIIVNRDSLCHMEKTALPGLLVVISAL